MKLLTAIQKNLSRKGEPGRLVQQVGIKSPKKG